MKLNVTTECGAFAWSAVPATQGAVPHSALFSATVVGDATGTLIPRPGMANVCWTEQLAHESKVCNGCAGEDVLPLKYETFSTPPMVPATRPQTGFLSGVHPSYPRIVTFTLVFAGTAKYVVCSKLPVLGFLMKYDTQSGLSVTVAPGVAFLVT